MDQRTQAERDYDAMKDGSAYVKEKKAEYTPLSPAWEAVLDILADPTNGGRAHAGDPDPAPNLPAEFKAWVDRHLADEEIELARDLDRLIAEHQAAQRQPFGTLADGTVMYGTFDTTQAGAGKRSGCVMVDLNVDG